MANIIPFDRASSLDLLTPRSVTMFDPEEEQHPWGARPYQIFNKPFLRIWDHYSGSQPSNGDMTSRAPYERLDTDDSRKTSLTIHVNYKDWRPTPYISFTTSPAAAQGIADMRNRRRGPHTLTVVDPDTRVEKGLPILDVAAEMEHYGIRDPYKNGGQFYKDHYACLWQVSRSEVVGEWQWDDLSKNGNWYENIVMPAFRRHREKTMHHKELNVSHPHDAARLLHGRSNMWSGELECHFEDHDGFGEVSEDTDDEAEEANAYDDIIKLMEGL